MRRLLGATFALAQYLCISIGVLLTCYLLYRWNAERTLHPAFDGFNPWWPGLIAFAIGGVFKFARKGVVAEFEAKERAEVPPTAGTGVPPMPSVGAGNPETHEGRTVNGLAQTRSRVARHWALPLAALSVLIAAGALVDGNTALLMLGGLALIAGYNVWTGLGARRVFGLDEFYGVGRRGPSPGFWIGLVLTALLLFGAGNALNEMKVLHTDAGERQVSDDGGAPMPAAISGGPSPDAWIRPLTEHTERIEVIREKQEAINVQAKEIVAELETPGLTQQRYDDLMRRVDLLEKANITFGCRLLADEAEVCQNTGGLIADPTEWMRVYEQMIADSHEFLAPL